MKIRNSTDFPDWFLRRMASWCCRQVGLKPGKLKLAVFRNSRSAWGGCARAWRAQISVCVGGANCFPQSCSTHHPGEKFIDRMECLVAVTAHEAYHVIAHWEGERTRGYSRGGRGSSERVTCIEEMRVLHLFREQRESLLAEWGKEPSAIARQAVPVVEKRAAKASADLERWQRKFKLAQTKIRKLKARVTYYARLNHNSPTREPQPNG